MIKPTIDEAVKYLVQRMSLPATEEFNEGYYLGALDMLALIYGEPLHRIRQLYTDHKVAKKIAVAG